MDVSGQFSVPLRCGSPAFWPSDLNESSSDGGCGSWSTASQPANFSDEEVMLASSHPKKRAGRKKFRETRHPVYRGVRRRNSGKWVCEVREPNKKSRIWLGTFSTAEMAARAHDVAAIALRGRSACLNFADSAWKLPIPASTDAKDIQKAAVEAAEEEFRRGTESEEISKEVGVAEGVFFMDEEAVFGMPELLANMAEGLMLPPPHHHSYGGDHDMEVVQLHSGQAIYKNLTPTAGALPGSKRTSDEEVMRAFSHPKKQAGRKKFRETRHPVYSGVRRRRPYFNI
ncbi:hypothetical protein Vadar_031153 [Vaccinium darrowii]|uniref:Uncharacterized protein n=1 Tax=Vaccinium darrowii TaxID=229202 RepID=A0ACB7YT28_9ERIC|nr:hypothetical protein Vadar_031153 [Vaccinium darrowii]